MFLKRYEKRLGFTNEKHLKTPKFLLKDDKIKQISTAFNHNLLLKENGDVIGFGASHPFKLILKGERTFAPKIIMSDPKIKRVFCSYEGTFVLMQDGSLFFHGKFFGTEYKNHLVISNPSINFVNHFIDSEWTPESHHLFSESFKISVFCFVCCLKVLNKKFDFKVPKYLTFIIVKSTI